MQRALSSGACLAVIAWASAAGAQETSRAELPSDRTGIATPGSIAIGDFSVAPVVEARARGEYRHDLDGQDRGLLVERARLGADVQRDALEARVVFQDARAIAFDAAGAGTVDGPIAGPTATTVTGVSEAWGEAHTVSARPSFLRIGMQPVTWGEGRLLGVADWSPGGRTLDAVRGRLTLGNGAVEVLAALLTVPQDSSSLDAYGELVGVRGQWAIDPLFAVEAYGLARFAQENPSTVEGSLEQTVRGQTYTAALHFSGDAHAWAWGAEAAYQFGRVDNGTASSVPAPAIVDATRSAWTAAAHVAHTFERGLLLPTVRLGVSYASGDSGNGTAHAFDPLLPDTHVWHGALDVFTGSNEEEASARVAIAPWTEGVATIEYRYARLAQAGGAWRSDYLVTIGQLATNTSAELGHEIDAVVTWSPWVPIELSAGYSALILGRGAKNILAAGAASPSVGRAVPDVAQLAYAQAALRWP